MDVTSVSISLLFICCLSIFTQAYDFIDAPFELNKLGAVATFPDSEKPKERTEDESPLKKILRKNYEIPLTTTPSPMEMHGRQAPISTTHSPIDDFHFSNDNYSPFQDRFSSKFDNTRSQEVGLQADDKFVSTGSREDPRIGSPPYARKEGSYSASKVDGYIMVDGKMQRFSRASSRYNGKPVTNQATVLKPVTLYMPTSRLSNNGEPEMTAVQGYVVGRQGSLGVAPRLQKNVAFGQEQGQPEYTMFVYPEKRYENNDNYVNNLHMPFTTPPPFRSGHSLTNDAKVYPEMIYANRMTPADDYRIPSGDDDAFMKSFAKEPTFQRAEPVSFGHNNVGDQGRSAVSTYIPNVVQPYQIDGRQSTAGGHYEQPAYNSYSSDNGQAYEGDYRRGQQYENTDTFERQPSYSQSRESNPRYANDEERYQNNIERSYGDSQNYENTQPYYSDNEPAYNNREQSYNGDSQPSYREQSQPDYRDRDQSYNEDSQAQNPQTSYTGQVNGNKGSFVQHSPPITRFIPYLNLNGNLVPKFKNGRYLAPSFDVSDSKKGRLPGQTLSVYGNAQRIVIICPRVTDTFCTESGHFSHPTHPSCFVQCDERRVPFVKTCPNNTEWRQNTHSCV